LSAFAWCGTRCDRRIVVSGKDKQRAAATLTDDPLRAIEPLACMPLRAFTAQLEGLRRIPRVACCPAGRFGQPVWHAAVTLRKTKKSGRFDYPDHPGTGQSAACLAAGLCTTWPGVREVNPSR